MIEKIHKLTFRLSPSALNLMKECPRCFWLHQRKVWRRPAGIFPSLPTGMDRILKVHFDKFRDKGQLPPELCENNNCKNMKLFDDKEKLKIWQNNFKGVSWIDKNGNELHGAVDNILVKGKKLIVLDYKTRGYALKEDTAEHYRLQQNIYNLLLRKNGFDIDETMTRIALMNLMMHGITKPNIDRINTLSGAGEDKIKEDMYEVVLANPPFKGSINESEISDRFRIKTKKTCLLILST